MCYHALIYPFILYVLLFQMKTNGVESADDAIHDLIFPLGRKHFTYRPLRYEGSIANHMELLGVLMVTSLMKSLPKDEIEPEKYVQIHQAMLVFFRVIVYWLQFGYTFQSRSAM